MFSSLYKCFPLLLHVVAEGVLQLHENMAICLFQVCAVTTSLVLMTWFHKAFPSKRFDFVAYTPSFDFNNFCFHLALYLPTTKEEHSSFTCFAFCSLFNDISAKWSVRWSQWFCDAVRSQETVPVAICHLALLLSEPARAWRIRSVLYV